jgi:beta-lactamase regulating signal transducer with metallopeptidase domain
MANETWSHLVSACLAASTAIALLLVLRWPLRKLFGATLAYQAWLVVPAMIVVALLPPLTVQHRSAIVAVLHASSGMLAAPAARAGVDWTGVLLAAWGAGAAALALWFWRAHQAFVRALGELTPARGLFYSTSPAVGPALLGLWRPKIVVPLDFEQRYTKQEQALVVAHERVHAQRADTLVNLAQAALQCIFWFNPLVHAAALLFRSDQEMACDAAVLRRHPGLLRTYAQALLKSQAFSTAAPPTVACNWRINHPVKERFMTLQQTQPRATRRVVGRILVASLILCGGYAGLAARADEAMAPGKPSYDVQVSMDQVEGETAKFTADGMLATPGGQTPHLITPAGEKIAIEKGAWRAEFVITPVSVAGKTFKLAANVTTEGYNYRPVLVGRLGEKMGVSVGSNGKRFDMAVLVKEAAPFPPKRAQ